MRRIRRPESFSALSTPAKFGLGAIGFIAVTGTSGLLISSCQEKPSPEYPEFSIVFGPEGKDFYKDNRTAPAPQPASTSWIFNYEPDGGANNGTLVVSDTNSRQVGSVDMHCNKAGNLAITDINTPTDHLLQSTSGYAVNGRYLPDNICTAPFEETFGKDPQRYGKAALDGIIAQGSAAEPGSNSAYLGAQVKKLVR